MHTRLLFRFVASIATVFLFSIDAKGNVVTYAGDGPFRNITGLLKLDSIPATSETTAECFIIPGSGPVDLTFTFRRDTGRFLFTFGYFDLSEVTTDPVMEKELWANQALSNATVVFDDRAVNPPRASTTKTLTGGTIVGFFLIPNNTLAAFHTDSGLFYPPMAPPTNAPGEPYRSPLFSVSAGNPGELDQMIGFIGGGKSLFSFEDLTRASFPPPTKASDENFSDMAFLIDLELVPEPATTMLAILASIIFLTGQRRCWIHGSIDKSTFMFRDMGRIE